MPPNFTKKIIDILGKRAGFICSNPDCRASTVGPNTDPEKSTLIGEAAHIFGARPSSKRYVPEMDDVLRAEITNAIWLCRNCHKLIDSDEDLYSSNLLYKWREQHEIYVLSELGNSIDKIQFEELQSKISQFENYPPIVRRIVIDKPDGWEYRLTAEIMRHLNAPYFRKLSDLREGLYIKQRSHLDSDEVVNWVRMRLSDCSNMMQPFVSLLDRLTKSWGEPGEPGNIQEIHHICLLIRDNLEEVVQFEETINFVNVPDEYVELADLIKDLMGSQVAKLESIPSDLDEVVSYIDSVKFDDQTSPKVIKKTIEFNVPVGWEKKMNRAIKKAEKRASNESQSGGSGFWSVLLIVIFIIWLVI